jgi:SAM-dependent methyltransferase
MLRVLQNWQEIGEATLALQRQGLPTHATVNKNWDQYLLLNALEGIDRRGKIIDLGCGDGHTLKLLHAAGFKNIHGLDFKISRKVRLSQISRMWHQRHWNPPFRLYQGNITKTAFTASSFDFAFSLSVIEHGVDVNALFREANRILKPQAKLFLTTDYWDPEISCDNEVRAFGLPWKVFSRPDIESMIELAGRHSLTLAAESVIPPCVDKTVHWQNTDYTFIQLLFVKYPF